MNMHSMRNDPSEIEVLSKKSGHCTVKVLKPKSTEALCKVSLEFFARAVQLSGGQGVRVREFQCSAKGDPYCQFELTWEA
jgi:predicted hydrocarbon binding protein